MEQTKYSSFYNKNIKYTSKKFPLFEYIFNKFNPYKTEIPLIQFTLQDITEAYDALKIKKPTSISNTVLDLTRKRNTIDHRLPQSIYSLGYDIRKKTGSTGTSNENYAGEFVYVGVGKELDQWLSFPKTYDESIPIESSIIPNIIIPFLRNDESAMLSVADYLDMFSKILHAEPQQVKRIQNPVKWQPNEIDGFYVCEWDNEITLYPVEAKALSTGDDINIYQLLGGINMLHKRIYSELHNKKKTKLLKLLKKKDVYIQPIAAVMKDNEIHFAIYEKKVLGSDVGELNRVKAIKTILTPPLINWIN